MAVRIALAAVALAIAAWLLLTLHWLGLEEEARGLVPPPPAQLSPATVDDARRLLQRAASGNPDTRPQLVESTALAFAGRYREAADVAEAILREEPDNIRAAINLRSYEQAIDPESEAAAAADRRVQALAPPVP